MNPVLFSLVTAPAYSPTNSVGGLQICLMLNNEGWPEISCKERVLLLRESLSQSAWAALIKYHRLGSLKDWHLFLIVLKAGSPRSGCRRGWVPQGLWERICSMTLSYLFVDLLAISGIPGWLKQLLSVWLDLYMAFSSGLVSVSKCLFLIRILVM